MATPVSGFVKEKAALTACLTLLLILNSALGCDRCVHQSKVAYYAYAGAVNVGACGYGSLGGCIYNGKVGAVSRWMFRGGAECNACYQIRCIDPNLCTKTGEKLMVIDFTESDQTDFVVTTEIFSNLALPGREHELFRMGIVDIEYKRIVCDHMGQHLSVKVDERSNYPSYLVVQFLYQGGQTNIVAVEVAQVGSYNWYCMKRNFGGIWDIDKPPTGPLQFRFLVTSGYDKKWVWSKYVLPSDWKEGVLYDSGLQIEDIAQESCSPCDTSYW
eukprot:Gb_29322 [translate_table: standard]